MSTPTNNSLFLIGGTGGLGTEVAKGLVTATGFESKKAIVRDASSDKAQALADMGWTLVEVKDLTDADLLETALAGVQTVVSTLSGNDMVSLESNIIQSAKKTGATLFVPSQFGVDFYRWGTEFPFLAGKKAVQEAAAAAELPVLNVFTGYFSDWIFGFFVDLENAKVTWIGDGSDKVSFTSRDDIGYVLAKALADPEYAQGGSLSMQGDYASFNEATKWLGESLGKDIAVEYMNADDAKKLESELLVKGLEGDVGAFFGSFKYHLMGEPARGNDGCNLSKQAKDYGHELKTLKQVFGSGVYSGSS
uniref:NmrA-like domain-containing protein n=1 Tax=Entomoneis paludosa TaxID=265537 RepID=A0A7S2Y4Y8_9STRA